MRGFQLLKKSILLFLICFLLVSCVSRGAAQAEEYFAIGMAFFDLGRYNEAETWLNRAQAADRTMVASEYNLGRIAYETGRYEDAARFFERVLSHDSDNVMALRAAAYSRIRNGDFERAITLYDRVLELIPESADDGFNYALVLYALEQYEESEEILNRYPIALEENPPSRLLLARTQQALGKPEAIDNFAKWVLNAERPHPQGLIDYASALESEGLYARAIEIYDDALEALPRDTATLTRGGIRFEKARLLLTVDPDNNEGIEEFNTAIREGFADTEALEELLEDSRLTQIHREEIQRALGIIEERIRSEEDDDDEDDDEDDEDDDDEDDDDTW